MSKNKRLKKLIATGALSLGVGMISMGLNATESFAHGYIHKSRAALANSGHNTNAGAVQYEPQSVEGPGNFPEAGPKDGQIASAGKFLELDEQTADRWVKVPMKSGKNTFNWTMTAPHRTKEYKYYITKKGWDPNKPLTRNDLEEIARIDGKNEVSPTTVNHTINIPSDRSGYHVILGVWEIADTGNAFYQVMDVNLDSGNTTADTQAPTAPTELKSNKQTTNSVDLNWKASTDNVGVNHYEIYRNNVKVGTSNTTQFTDTELKADTEYTYIVKAVDNAGNISKESNTIKVKTSKLPSVDNEAPTAPKNLHSMGETESSIDLMWTKSTDNVLVSKYNIYRDGVLIHTTSDTRYKDSNLSSNTEYKYVIEAVDSSGNVSEKSNELRIKTKANSQTPEVPDVSGTWDKSKAYLAGDVVTYNGLEYKAKWWTRGDIPGQSDVWELTKKDVISEWTPNRAYVAGDRVTFEGKVYEAKWWVKGERPNNSSAWEQVK